MSRRKSEKKVIIIRLTNNGKVVVKRTLRSCLCLTNNVCMHLRQLPSSSWSSSSSFFRWHRMLCLDTMRPSSWSRASIFSWQHPGCYQQQFQRLSEWGEVILAADPGLRKTSGRTFTTSFSSESHKLCTCEQVRTLTSIASDRKTLKRWVERTIFQSPGQRSIVKYTLNCAIKIP